MFGLTFEKLFLVAIVAGVVIGPQRLPYYAHRLATTLRGLREMVDSARRRAEDEMGVRLTAQEWEALDPRRYDPRRIVRDALDERPQEEAADLAADTGAAPSVDRSADPPSLDPSSLDPMLLEQARAVRPGQRYLVTGSAAHPRRTLIADLPADDPRRLASERPEDEAAVAAAGRAATARPSATPGVAPAQDGQPVQPSAR